MKSHGVTIQMKATEQYFPVVLFIMLYKVVLTFESVDEILWCDHLNESYWAVLSCGTVYYAVQGDSNFWGGGRNPMLLPFKWNLFSSIFTWFQRVEIKPVVFADEQENYWLWYSASHHQKNTTCPEKDWNIKINKGAPPNASVGEGRGTTSPLRFFPRWESFFQVFLWLRLTPYDTNLLHCVCSKPHCWHSAPKEQKSHNNW